MNPFLAHSVGSGSASNVDLIVIAGGVAALGIAFVFQKTVPTVVSVVMVAAGITGVVLGLTVFKEAGGGDGETVSVQGQTFPVTDLTDAAAGLCDARAAAAAGEVDDAETIFANRAHQPLHVIGAAVEDEDRGQAARLLEAKQAVETLLFEERVDAEALVAALEELTAATTVALATLEITAVTC